MSARASTPTQAPLSASTLGSHRAWTSRSPPTFSFRLRPTPVSPSPALEASTATASRVLRREKAAGAPPAIPARLGCPAPAATIFAGHAPAAFPWDARTVEAFHRRRPSTQASHRPLTEAFRRRHRLTAAFHRLLPSTEAFRRPLQTLRARRRFRARDPFRGTVSPATLPAPAAAGRLQVPVHRPCPAPAHRISAGRAQKAFLLTVRTVASHRLPTTLACVPSSAPGSAPG